MAGGNSKKIAYAGACVAISQIGVLLSAFTPVQIVSLIIVSLAIYVAFRRCGVIYGIISAVACALLTFAITGVRITFIFTTVLFIPYAVIAYAMHKLPYQPIKFALLRLLIVGITFFSAFLLITLLFDVIAGTTMATIITKIGIVPTALVVMVVCLPVDLFFYYGAERVIKLLR
ncbi:MAG: hypothetical protein IKC64_01550 [Clostridia bacterium]|nr:hypothetical protein [Clostridia bacterium]